MSAFNEHCSAVVKDYVQTVLIIDDQAGLRSPENTVVADIIDDLPDNNPLTQRVVSAAEGVTESGSDITTESASHQLNALELTSAFYQKGIVAGLYQPQIEDGEDVEVFAQKTEKVAATADIIILDWMLKGSDSNYSKAIVKKIIKSDRSAGGRIRNIIIYTGEKNLTELKNALNAELNDENIKSAGDYQLTANSLKISFYNKPNSGGIEEREVTELNLPTKALQEFEALVNGLIPTFAMKAAATIRHNTGRIISRFGSDLDTAFLAHRALLPKVEDAEAFMLENYISYLRNILAINKVDKQTLDSESIIKWIDHNHDSLSKVLTFKNKDYTFEIEDFKILIDKGFLSNISPILEKYIPNKSTDFVKSKTSILSLTQTLNKQGSEGCVDHHSKNLSILTSFRRTFEDLVAGVELPYLTQGTIIYSIDEKVFLLCITPKCDTARVESSRIFSFTKLKRVSKGKEFDLVLPITKLIEKAINVDLIAEIKEILSDLGYDPYGKAKKNQLDNNAIKQIDQISRYFYPEKVFVKSESSFFDLVHIEFNSGAVSRVMPAQNINGDFEYVAHQNQGKYVWLGDLEDLDTQNRVSNLVGNLNRIGTNEVEWLRRQYQ
jgi:hypothetical protein